jgi:fructokinase
MNFNIVAVGEVLWDLFPEGPLLGGAPANFAYHAHALGAQVQLITRVGNDELGREILRRFREMGLSDATVQVDETAPTGTVKVQLSGNGLAHFTIQESVAWDFIALTDEALAAARHADAICFGSLAQRSEMSRETIRRLVEAAPANALKVFDINLRQKFYSREVIEESLKWANVLKLNDDELPTLAAMLGPCGAGAPARVPAPESPRSSAVPPHEIQPNEIQRLAQAFDLQLVALTRGPKGSLLYQVSGDQERWSDCGPRPVKVVDTVGAGDSFTAALVLGLLLKMDLDEINSIANDVAGYVCSQAGGTPELPVEFARKFDREARWA